jgi:hypothetical protein
MKDKVLAWLRLFRVVNLPTVPGDVLVGAACVAALNPSAYSSLGDLAAPSIAGAAFASVLLYMYGLADNDIVGAKTDQGRPIPDGLVSLFAARLARALCWFGTLAIGYAVRLPPEWWCMAMLLLVSIALYNRTKTSVHMGLCRALNVLCGAAALSPRVIPVDTSRWEALANRGAFAALAAAFVWLVYIAAVTKYSEGEELDDAKKTRVGFLVGAIVYLQLAALLALALVSPAVKPMLVAGALLLVALRVSKRLFPRVSAS